MPDDSSAANKKIDGYFPWEDFVIRVHNEKEYNAIVHPLMDELGFVFWRSDVVENKFDGRVYNPWAFFIRIDTHKRQLFRAIEFEGGYLQVPFNTMVALIQKCLAERTLEKIAILRNHVLLRPKI